MGTPAISSIAVRSSIGSRLSSSGDPIDLNDGRSGNPIDLQDGVLTNPVDVKNESEKQDKLNKPMVRLG